MNLNYRIRKIAQELHDMGFDEDADYILDELEINSQREKKLQSKKKTPIKYYHSSPQLFKPGDMIRPFQKPNFRPTEEGCIYMTAAPAPHYTVAERAFMEGWHVYEVKPTGKVFFQSTWDDYFSYDPAIVVKLVGTARGLGKLGRKKLPRKEIDSIKMEIEELKQILSDPAQTELYIHKYKRDPRKRLEQYMKKLEWGKYEWSKGWTKTYAWEPKGANSDGWGYSSKKQIPKR